MARPVLTLLTDFGGQDPYVGIMKGQILGLCPEAQLVDLTHEIAPQDLVRASFHLEQSAPYFPPGTVHLAVVDPGVGSSRAMVAVQTPIATFVAPDNGLLTRVLDLMGPVEQMVRLPLPEGASHTFHGRDVMAPAAGRIAAGVPLAQLGPNHETLVRLDFPQPVILENQVEATVLAVDRFGNVTFDLPRRAGEKLFTPGTSWTFQDTEIPVCRTYAEVELGDPVLLWGSQNLLELALRQGHAARRFQLQSGELCRLFKEDSSTLSNEIKAPNHGQK